MSGSVAIHNMTVVPLNQSLRLSPSAIERFLSCPRQFYYQHLLHLRVDKTSTQAVWGNLVHQVMESFNRYHPMGYTQEGLGIRINEIFKDAVPEAGESAKPILLNTFSQIQRVVFEQKLQGIARHLDQSGYFKVPFQQLWAEYPLMINLAFMGYPHINLAGRIDLLRENRDGSFTLIDYKTSSQQFCAVGEETSLKPLLQALNPWDEIQDIANHIALQLPLYWLMLKSQPDFKDKPIHIQIQTLRVPKATQPYTGCRALTIPHEVLARSESNLVDTLKRGVLEPLTSLTQFLPLGQKETDCRHCAYLSICEGGQEDETDGFE